MALWVKVLAAKAVHLSLTPGPTWVEGGDVTPAN